MSNIKDDLKENALSAVCLSVFLIGVLMDMFVKGVMIDMENNHRLIAKKEIISHLREEIDYLRKEAKEEK